MKARSEEKREGKRRKEKEMRGNGRYSFGGYEPSRAGRGVLGAYRYVRHSVDESQSREGRKVAR